jgi:hypothetical protein
VTDVNLPVWVCDLVNNLHVSRLCILLLLDKEFLCSHTQYSKLALNMRVAQKLRFKRIMSLLGSEGKP